MLKIVRHIANVSLLRKHLTVSDIEALQEKLIQSDQGQGIL